MTHVDQHLLQAEILKKAETILSQNRLLFLTGQQAIESATVIQSIASYFQKVHRPGYQIVAARRFASPGDFKTKERSIIFFHNVSDNYRFDLNDFAATPESIQHLIDQDNYIIISLSEDAHHWLYGSSRLGEWHCTPGANLHLKNGFNPAGLSHWFADQARQVRREQVISSQQKRFLTSEYVTGTVTKELHSPRLLHIFLRAFAVEIDVRDPEFEEDFEDILYDVQYPEAHLRDWYGRLNRSQQLFLQMMLFLADSDRQIVWQTYQEAVQKLRKFAPALAADPTGVIMQQTAKVVSPQPAPDLVEPFAQMVQQIVIQYNSEYLDEVLPLLQNLALRLPEEAANSQTHRWLKGIAYGMAQVGSETENIVALLYEWLCQEALPLKEAGAFGLAVYFNKLGGDGDWYEDVMSQLQTASAPHERLSAVYLAAAVGRFAPTKSLESLKALVLKEAVVAILEAIIQTAANLARQDADTVFPLLQQIAEKTAAGGLPSLAIVEQLTDIAAQSRFRSQVLQVMHEWAAHPEASVRWVCATFMLQNTEQYQIQDVVAVIQSCYESDGGAQDATISLICGHLFDEATFGVLRQLMRVGQNMHKIVVGQILKESAETVSGKVANILQAWAVDKAVSVRIEVPFLVQSCVADYQPDEKGAIVPFSDPSELFALVGTLRQDRDVSVRSQMVSFLPLLAEYGGQQFFEMVGQFSQDEDASVRRQALHGLHTVHTQDPKAAISSSRAFFSDADETVRMQTLPILLETAVAHSMQVLSAVGELINDPSSNVKLGLLPIIKQAAPQVPVTAVDLLSLLTIDDTVSADARPVFVNTAISLVGAVIHRFSEYINQPEQVLKLAAIEAMSGFPTNHHAKIINIVSPTTHHEDREVKLAVIALLDRVYPTVPQPTSELLARFTLDESVTKQAESMLLQVVETHFDESKDSLIHLAKEEKTDAHLIAARISRKVAIKVPSKIMPVLQALSEYRDEQVLTLILDAVETIATVEPEATLYVLANTVSAEIEPLTQRAMTLSNRAAVENSSQVFAIVQKLIRDSHPFVRNMAINAFGQMPPKFTAKLTDVLRTALPAETDRTNKLEGLRILTEKSQYRLLNTAEAMVALCLDYDVGEAAQRQFATMTRIPYEEDQKILQALAVSRNWPASEIRRRLSLRQYGGFLLYRLVSEFQK
jgi:hypothetical protein